MNPSPSLRPSRAGRTMVARLLAVVFVSAALMGAAVPAAAQVTELGRQSLGRPYWHVFAAYALVVLLIAGWVVSIARRISRIEQRLPDLDERS